MIIKDFHLKMILKIQFAFISAPYWKPFFCLIFFVDVFFSFFFSQTYEGFVNEQIVILEGR